RDRLPLTLLRPALVTVGTTAPPPGPAHGPFSPGPRNRQMPSPRRAAARAPTTRRATSSPTKRVLDGDTPDEYWPSALEVADGFGDIPEDRFGIMSGFRHDRRFPW